MELTIVQQIIVGTVQGITEWLPISSSAFIVLIMSNLFSITEIDIILRNTLFLHLGTFFAALIYFRKEISNIILSLINYKSSGIRDKKIIKFLFLSTIISGTIGLTILKLIEKSNLNFNLTGKIITLIIASLLLITGIIQIRAKTSGIKTSKNLKNSDSILLGFAQGISVLPGLSRSGTTVSTLLLRKFDDTTSLKLSFLMSLPIILLGNIFLNINEFVLNPTAIYGLISAFVFGIITIHLLMKLSKRINFGWFILIFSILMGTSILI